MVGKEEGKTETLKDIIQNMLSLGKSETEIMQVTGLSREDMKKIIADINKQIKSPILFHE